MTKASVGIAYSLGSDHAVCALTKEELNSFPLRLLRRTHPFCAPAGRTDAASCSGRENLSTEMNERRSPSDLLKASLLYQEFAAEREEILRHKWFESEKAGHDIGFDLAQVDWHMKHRSQWRKGWQEKRVSSAS